MNFEKWVLGGGCALFFAAILTLFIRHHQTPLPQAATPLVPLNAPAPLAGPEIGKVGAPMATAAAPEHPPACGSEPVRVQAASSASEKPTGHRRFRSANPRTGSAIGLRAHGGSGVRSGGRALRVRKADSRRSPRHPARRHPRRRPRKTR